MTSKHKKALRKFLRATVNFFLIVTILFFQYFIPLYSTATCNSDICGPNCISMDPDTCTCFPAGCNTSSTSGSTSGTIMCSNGQPICPLGQSYSCPSGQAPCCLFSGEAGCANGLSCFGGVGSCVTSTTSTSSTSSTTGGPVMCGGDTTPDCPVGQNYFCGNGESPCCLQFSDEAGCSNGLSCYGGRGQCVTSTSSTSTSSTTGGPVMCGGDTTPDCPVGQNYFCGNGESPCCLQFSDEAGCSNGLSCYGGRGQCVTSTSSTSTSSTTGGPVMCGGDTTPDCPVGQNYICPSGAAPCCIQFSDEAGCSYGLSCFGGQGFCGTSSTSSSSTSSGGSSSSGGNVPFCSNGQITCNSGSPLCTSGLIPDCGSNYGLTGDFAGQGCITPSMNLFFVGTSFCSLSQRVFLPTKQVKICQDKESICPINRERFQFCREDKTTCSCVCQFKTKSARSTPRCDNFNLPACSGKQSPTCSKPNNVPVCLDGKLSCQDKDFNSIDLADVISCEKKIKSH